MRFNGLILVLFLFGCSPESEWSYEQADIVKSKLVYDHYETTYKLRVNGESYHVNFDVNVWLMPGEYTTRVYWRVPEGRMEPVFQMRGDFTYRKRDIEYGDTVYEAEVAKVISLNNYNAIELQWKENSEKTYSASFTIDQLVYIGNKMLITSDGDRCNLVAWHMKHSNRSSDGFSLFPYFLMF